MAATSLALEERLIDRLERVGQRITIPWTTASDGTFSEEIKDLRGFIVAMYFQPGSPAPTDNYDITLKRSGPSGLTAMTSLDVLNGAALDRDTANAEMIPLPNTGINTLCYVNGDYTFAIANGGSAKQGVCEILIKNR